jgi:hypothetical protein
MPQKLLTLPLRIGFGAARTALGISTRLAATAIDLVRPGSSPSPTSAPPSSRPTQPPPGPDKRTPAAPERSDPRANGRPEAPPVPRTPPDPPAPITPPAEQPDTPVSSEQAAIKTIDDEDEVVAEFAEPGAEDGAGAAFQVDEPWEGYARMKADAIITRIGEADAAELAILELYEQTHKKRQRVLATAAKRLRSLSPPG